LRQASSALRPLTRLRALALLSVLALVLAACGGGDKGGEGNSGQAQSGGTVVFAASSDPKGMDPALVSDGESSRVTNQIFEGLVRTKSGSLEIEPALAESWTANGDGTEWTFKLRSGVRFHDGTPFNAEAVCFNFDRQYNFKGLLQNEALSYYWNTFFGGFSDKKKPSLYVSCSAPDETTAVIKLASASASFIPAMSQFAFAIQSPKALQEFGADKVSGNEEAPKFHGTYALEHPTGTGPMRFDSYKANDRVTLVRNDGYWGTKATVDRLIFRTISDNAARRQALEAGEIQGYDQVDPADLDALRSNFNVLERPPLNLAYVGMNQSKPPLDNPKIRQAVAYALNRDELLKAKYPPGAQVAKEFMPPDLPGYADDVTQYTYDPAKAKQLIAESGVKNPTIEFWYPTNVSRPYMPDPAANFQAFRANLEAVGFKVIPKSAPWSPDYLSGYQSGAYQMYLIGWNADFGDADNFLGVFFQEFRPEWGFRNQQIFDLLNQAEAETDTAKRSTLYQQANKAIMDFLPGVPYAHTSSYIAMAKNVQGLVPSPLSNENFAVLTSSQ
jgi:peptide/nickel transport system substrate-binding protein